MLEVETLALVSSEVEIGASKERTWEVLADFHNVIDWNPFLSEAGGIGEVLQGVGTGRSCTMAGGGDIEEFVTGWTEGQSLEWRVTGMPGAPPSVCSMSIGHVGDGVATLKFDFDFEGDMPAHQREGAKQQMAPMVETLANAFKHFVETGERMQIPSA